MKEFYYKMEDIKNADLSKKEIVIIDLFGNIIGKITPVTIESCMNPGRFHIKPIEIQFDKKMIMLKNDRETIKLLQEDLEEGKMKLMAEEFTPKLKKIKNDCTKCTNCGRCSW